MIKTIVPSSLIVIATSSPGVVVLAQKETKLNPDRLIVGDAILAESSRLRFAKCVHKKLKMSNLVRCAPRTVKRPLRILKAKPQPWQGTLFLVLIVPGTTTVVP